MNQRAKVCSILRVYSLPSDKRGFYTEQNDLFTIKNAQIHKHAAHRLNLEFGLVFLPHSYILAFLFKAFLFCFLFHSKGD